MGNLLPIGTIVTMETEEELAYFMIMGYFPISVEQPDKVWDYAMVPYPFGYSSGESVIMCDNEQISAVMAMGYQDTEQFAFAEQIEESYTEIKSQMMTEESDREGEE